MKNPEKFNAFVRDGKRFVVRADGKLTAFMKLESAIRVAQVAGPMRSI
jgi:hypothetical protein